MCTYINFKMSIYAIPYYSSFDLSTVCIEMLIQPGKTILFVCINISLHTVDRPNYCNRGSHK